MTVFFDQTPSDPPESLLPWLTWDHSLTDKLQALAGEARLEVLSHEWGKSDAWDQSCLNLRQEAQVIHRTIVMWAFESPCWYARTILPKATYDRNQVVFDRLKTESLGALIFGDTEIERLSLMYYPVSSFSIEYAWLESWMHQNASVIWVRLSEFQMKQGGVFFLVELLLPGLMEYLS
jgi:chorismate lyase